ncbi:hypothetical protein FEM03_05135 [Phragmitibacter flavus]|uniref:Uncharacterized protein n=1 Tax=Phragmitibacter flavus TaxID=2576071 RepID=A0A5R8KIG9_9BACT|nr:hypothetical protein [Phragmitibacter flavus]TLD72113.1 hypothetical protein FEM03_05135 [Phragmitibacter flavus]
MKLSSILFGDLADLYQDSRIEDAHQNSQVAASSATINRVQLAQLTDAIEKKFSDLEKQNAVVSLLLLKLFNLLLKEHPQKAATIQSEIQAALSIKPSTDATNLLRRSLQLPEVPKPTNRVHKKPQMKPSPRPRSQS